MKRECRKAARTQKKKGEKRWKPTLKACIAKEKKAGERTRKAEEAKSLRGKITKKSLCKIKGRRNQRKQRGKEEEQKEMSGANPENPNNINSSSSTSGSSSNSSSDNGNGDGNACGKGGIECDSNLQLRLYRATMLATPLIFALVLLSLLCMFCIRRCREHPQLLRRRSTHQNHHQSIDMTRVPHQQYGLSKSFRDSLPVVLYNNGLSSSFQDSQCAVCLGDYLQDEKIKHLPACNHCFHVQCIDKWLSTNLTCPICRTPLIRSEEIGNVTEQSNRNRIWEERVTQSQGRVDVVNDMSTIGTPPGNVLIGEVVVVGMDRS